METYKTKTTYQGIEIGLTDNFQFVILNEEISGDLNRYLPRFESMAKAKERIDDHKSAVAKQAKTKLKVDALDDNGEDVVVKGIHAVQSTVLPERAGFYAKHPKIQEFLVERLKLRARIKEIDKIIRPYEVENRRGWGRTHSDNYNYECDKLVAEFAEKEAKARKAWPI